MVERRLMIVLGEVVDELFISFCEVLIFLKVRMAPLVILPLCLFAEGYPRCIADSKV